MSDRAPEREPGRVGSCGQTHKLYWRYPAL